MNIRPRATDLCLPACLLLLVTVLCIPCVSALTLTPGGSGSVPVIAQGDPVTISGIATGNPQVGLQIWIIGPNFVKVTTISVNPDDSYEYNLLGTDTTNLAPGQYFVIVQHPMENDRFDIVYNAATGAVENVQTGQIIFQLTGSGSLQSPNAAMALLSAIASQNIDDTFATVSFFVSQPAVGITSIGTVPQGTIFTLNGTTNLAAGDNLMVAITSSSFGPTAKTGPSGFSGAGGMVTVQPGNAGENTWSFTVDTSAFPPDEYLVTVNGIVQTVSASARFTVVPATACSGSGETCPLPGLIATNATTPAMPAAALTENSTPVVPATTGAPASATTMPTTTNAPLPAAVCLTGIAAVLLLRRRS